MIKSQRISIENRIRQVQGNITSDMGGEKVMLSIDHGKYYNLGEMGGDIWERINKTISVQELMNSLVNTYDIEESKCEEEVLLFLTRLLEEDLIQIES